MSEIKVRINTQLYDVLDKKFHAYLNERSIKNGEQLLSYISTIASFSAVAMLELTFIALQVMQHQQPERVVNNLRDVTVDEVMLIFKQAVEHSYDGFEKLKKIQAEGLH